MATAECGPIQTASGPRARAHRQHGFTLIEILVALSVLAIAVVGLMRTFNVGLAWAGRSHDRTVAVELAQQRLELVKAWVDGSRDRLTRATRLDELLAPPWQERRTPLAGEISRFARETIIGEAPAHAITRGEGAAARVITVRVYLGDAATPLAELSTIVTAHP